MLLKLIWKQLAGKANSFSRGIVIKTTTDRTNLNKPVFYFSEEEHNNGNQQSNSRRYQKHKPKNRQRNQSNEDIENQKPNLTRLLRAHRTRMDQGGELSDYAYGCKKIASYYKKPVHQEFTNQKEQLERILESVNDLSLTNIKLEEYLYLLDFIRIMGRIESISRFVYEKAKDKLVSHLKGYIQKLEDMTLQELMPLYCRIGPMNLTSGWKISMVLHDRLADVYNEKGKLSLPMMQSYILIKSLAQRTFLSFPDKKILEMVLLTLKAQAKNIDNTMMIKFAIALKNCNIKANISDQEIYQISDRILGRAVQIIKKGIKFEQFEYILQNDPTDNPYFREIYQISYAKTIQKFYNPSQSEHIRLSNVRTLSLIVKHLRHYYVFPPADRSAVLQYLNMLIQNPQEAIDKKAFNVVILELLRNNFFGKQLDELSALLKKSKIQIYWSFPVQYSYQNIAFPAELIEPKIKPMTHKFEMELNYLKMAVSVAIQSRLHPTSELLDKCYKGIIEELSGSSWRSKQTEWVIRQSVNDPQLVRQFHLLYSRYYVNCLLPSQQQMKKDNQLQRGEKSSIYKFWEYLLLAYSYNQQLPYQLVYQIPDYAVFLVMNRQINCKNVMPDAKKLLLLTLYLKLSSQKIKFNMNQGHLICDLLIKYEPLLHNQDESFIELYWDNILQCIKYYNRLQKSLLSSFHFLLSKLLTLNNKKLTNSQYYRRFIEELLHNKFVLNLQSSYVYLKTLIIRQGLHLNLISPHSLVKMEWNYFTKAEQQMMQATTQQFQVSEWNVSSLVSYFKMSRPTSKIEEQINQINELIDSSSIQELEQYLIHFSLSRGTYSDNILLRIADRFILKMQIKDVNIIGILSNIKTPLRTINETIFQNLLFGICQKLISDPSTHFLADHLQIVKTLLESGLNCEKYEQMLLKYVKQLPNNGAISIEIMYALTRKGVTITNEDFELVRNYFIKNPEAALKIALLNEDTIVNSKQFYKTVVKYLSKPLKQSLYTLHLEKKESLLFPKQNSQSSLLNKPNDLSSQFLKSLQANEIDVVHEQKYGEHIYLIKQKIAVAFLEMNCFRQIKFIEKTLHLLYPSREIILVRMHASAKDISNLLDSLRSYNSGDSTKVKLIRDDIYTKIREQLHLM